LVPSKIGLQSGQSVCTGDVVVPLLELEEFDEEELEEEEDDLPLLELDEEELEEDEDDLLLPELDDDELLLELEEPLGVPPVTVTEVRAGRPVPLPQNPKLAVPPFAAIDAL
jgi:hypothetical protein